MRKVGFAVAFAVVLLAAVPAHADNRHGDGRWWWGHDRRLPWAYGNNENKNITPNPSDTISVPEPSSFLMLGSGLIMLAGLALLRRNNTA